MAALVGSTVCVHMKQPMECEQCRAERSILGGATVSKGYEERIARLESALNEARDMFDHISEAALEDDSGAWEGALACIRMDCLGALKKLDEVTRD